MRRKTGKQIVDKRWIPVRRGHIYCSPACGAACSYLEFVSVTRTAQAMVKALGPGWTTHVHENMGWYGKAENGPLTVSRNDRGPAKTRYACANYGDQTVGWFKHDARTPREAVAGCVRKLRAKYREITRSMESINSAGRGCMS